MGDLARDALALPEEFARLAELGYEERESEGEVSPQLLEELERVAGDIVRVRVGVAKWHMYAKGKQEAAKAELKPLIDALSAKLKGHTEKLEFIEFLMKKLLPPGQDVSYVDDEVTIYYSPSEATEAKDEQVEEDTPLEFCESKYVPAKKKIKEAILKWRDDCAAAKAAGKAEPPHPCPGWDVVVRWNLRVGLGGPAAEKNAKARAKKRGIAAPAEQLKIGEGEQ